MLLLILAIVIGLVAWALQLMEKAIEGQEFSLMLAGFFNKTCVVNHITKSNVANIRLKASFVCSRGRVGVITLASRVNSIDFFIAFLTANPVCKGQPF